MTEVPLSVWGPKFWTLLHSLVEKSQCQNGVFALTGEKAYTLLEYIVPNCIPCQECRQGFLKFKAQNPIHAFRYMEGHQLASVARIWLWNLHEGVNKRTNKYSVELSKLPALYGNSNIPWLLDAFVASIQPLINTNSALQDPSKTIEAEHIEALKALVKSMDCYTEDIHGSVLFW